MSKQGDTTECGLLRFKVSMTYIVSQRQKYRRGDALTSLWGMDGRPLVGTHRNHGHRLPTVGVQLVDGPRHEQRHQRGGRGVVAAYIVHQLLLGYENADDLVSFPQRADGIGDEIDKPLEAVARAMHAVRA